MQDQTLTLRASMTRSLASSSPSIMLRRVRSSGLLRLSMFSSHFWNNKMSLVTGKWHCIFQMVYQIFGREGVEWASISLPTVWSFHRNITNVWKSSVWSHLCWVATRDVLTGVVKLNADADFIIRSLWLFESDWHTNHSQLHEFTLSPVCEQNKTTWKRSDEQECIDL